MYSGSRKICERDESGGGDLNVQMNEFPERHVKVPSWELFILHIAKRSWPAGGRLSGTILHATNICRKTFEQERQNNRNLRRNL